MQIVIEELHTENKIKKKIYELLHVKCEVLGFLW